jgi:hypothetical protein
MGTNLQKRKAFTTLRRMAVNKTAETSVEKCDMCRVVIPSRHRHLLEVETRQMLCACDACAMRFYDVVGGRYKLIPRDSLAMPNLQISAAEWDSLSIPINLAFFYYSTPQDKIVAMYPSPAGAMESLLKMDTWENLSAENRPLVDMEADVEALLVNRVGGQEAYFIVPIDACFKLVGLIRSYWRGLSGGDVVWKEIADFFRVLKNKARVVQ